MKDLLKENISNHICLTPDEMSSFCNLFHRKEIKKKSHLLKEGEICRFEGFVVEGLFRVYNVDKNGTEHVLYFALENWWITDIESFTNETPSEFSIEALENSVVLLISKADKELAYLQLPNIEKLFRIMTQKTHIALQRRMINNLSKTAYHRYIDFVEKFPKHHQRISNHHIASYLGISREFLSKIRRKIADKK